MSLKNKTLKKGLEEPDSVSELYNFSVVKFGTTVQFKMTQKKYFCKEWLQKLNHKVGDRL